MKITQIVLLASSLVCSLAFAEAGNGGGVNGPDLAGHAIPTQLDRELEVGQFRQVLNSCAQQFARRVLPQIYGAQILDIPGIQFYGQPEVFMENSNFDLATNRRQRMLISMFKSLHNLTIGAYTSQSDPSFNRVYGAVHIYGRHTTMTILRLPGTGYVTGQFANGGFRYDIHNSASEQTLVPRQGKLNLPYFTYDVVAGDRSYDSNGDILHLRQLVRNLILQAPHNARPIPLKDEVTGKDVELRIDFREYRDCLLNGVQG